MELQEGDNILTRMSFTFDILSTLSGSVQANNNRLQLDIIK